MNSQQASNDSTSNKVDSRKQQSKEKTVKRISYKDLTFQLLYNKQEIEQTVCETSEKVNAYYKELLKGEQSPSVTVVCILKGAFMFFSDLIKTLDFKIQCEFIRLSSYHGGLKSSDKVEFKDEEDTKKRDWKEMFGNKHILIVEDIVDTGKTLEALMQRMNNEASPKSINIATMILRPDKKQTIEARFVGKHCSDFIIGYGLDLDEKFRNLPQIYQKI